MSFFFSSMPISNLSPKKSSVHQAPLRPGYWSGCKSHIFTASLGHISMTVYMHMETKIYFSSCWPTFCLFDMCAPRLEGKKVEAVFSVWSWVLPKDSFIES